MDLLPELEGRHAYRGMAEEPLPREQVERLLKAACLAPSCYNNQPWRLIAVSGETLVRLREALSEGNRWATRAPLIIVLATKPSLDCRLDAGRDYAHFDLGQAALALQLQAVREGLRAHPIAGYSAAKVKKTIGLPEDFVPLCLIIVGKPGDDGLLTDWQKERERGGRERKALGEVAFDNEWERSWETKSE